jgi:hypothetical protein
LVEASRSRSASRSDTRIETTTNAKPDDQLVTSVHDGRLDKKGAK